jgi:hypothetical protein
MASSPRASKPIGEEAVMASCWTVRRQRSRQQVADDGETTEQGPSSGGSASFLARSEARAVALCETMAMRRWERDNEGGVAATCRSIRDASGSSYRDVPAWATCRRPRENQDWRRRFPTGRGSPSRLLLQDDVR